MMQGGTPLVAHATCAFLNLGRITEKSAGPPGLKVGPVDRSQTGVFKNMWGTGFTETETVLRQSATV